MMAAVNEVNNDKTKEPDEFIFVVLRSFVLLPNSMSKLIHNQCTCKLIIKIMAAHVYYVCVLCFSLLFFSPLYSPLKIILKQLFASGPVNFGEYSP